MKMQDTSLEAFESVYPGIMHLSTKILWLTKESEDKGRTCDELEVITGGLHQSVSAQIRSLVKREWLEGKKDPSEKDGLEKRNTRTGRRAIVWVTCPKVTWSMEIDEDGIGHRGIWIPSSEEGIPKAYSP